MSKKIIKRCIRPQCMEIYSENSTNRYCDCGAILQLTEIDVPDKKTYKSQKETVRQDKFENKKKIGSLYLIPEKDEEEEVEFKLGRKNIIGRSSDTIAVDVDLSQFGHLVSRKHALITYEENGFYITNLSESHSVHVNNRVVIKGQKMKLTSEDGIILSKQVLLQFIEDE